MPISPTLMRGLRARAAVPLVKIDEPMARRAVQISRKLGVLYTAERARDATMMLIDAVVAEDDRQPELVSRHVPGAYEALHAGDTQEHDRLLVSAAMEIEQEGVDAVLLAQVSMARALRSLQRTLANPVFASLDTSLQAVKELGNGQVS